jgi:O-antigen/teichoic acid export membrane protein
MVVDAPSHGNAAVGSKSAAVPWRMARRVGQRLSWGVADQAVSSLTNFAVSIYVARVLGATQLGAFSLAYVTYGFMLNASRGLATDPLLVRFSGAELPRWRQAVADCTGTAVSVGLASGVCAIVASLLLHGTASRAFLALGITLPGLLLQDSWRFSFFALGKGSQAFLNDLIWVVVMFPALFLLNRSGHADVFWFVFTWGAAATVAAAAGPLQAKVIPRLSGTRRWMSRTRDLGVRYLLEGTANSASTQLRNYGVGLILGLAALGYVQASSTLMGPFMVIFFGMGLVTLPEATRILRRSPRHLPLFCMGVSGGLAVAGLVWGLVLLYALPRGLGNFILPNLWRPTYPLILPLTISIVGGCVSAGAGCGLHALGAARRSLRAMVLGSVVYVICGVTGAAVGGVEASMQGIAVAGWVGAAFFWLELRAELRNSGNIRLLPFGRPRQNGRHRKMSRLPEATAEAAQTMVADK